MRPALFRSPEAWKSALMTLPDGSYFELMRSVFGNIKTPFNKQRLMDDLAVFLSRREIQETIAAYLDHADIKVIAAIAVLDEPAPGELESFFAGEFTYAELHGLLLNLEERLILYRFKEKGLYRLALNPLLEPVLAPFIEDKRCLLSSFSPETDGPEEAPVPAAAVHVDDCVLAALFAFAAGGEGFFKAEGGFRKKVLEEGRLLFPGLDPECAMGGLQCLGLLRPEEDRFIQDDQKLAFFKKLSSRERLEYFAAGMAIYLNKDELSFPYFQRNRGQTLARLIHALGAALEPDRRYPRIQLQRILDVLKREDAEAGFFRNPEGDPPESPDSAKPRPAPAGRTGGGRSLFDLIPEVMERAGLLEPAAPGVWRAGTAVPPPGDGVPPENPSPGDTAGTGRPVLAMDTAFSCILYPEITFADALSLAAFCSVRETGTAVRFEISRESAVRGFDRGIGSGDMLVLLDRLSGNQVGDNLRWTLKDWETRYSGVSLYQGIVLTLAEDRRYLAETGALAALITRTLSPGVYLLSAVEKAEAVQVLQKAGIDIIAQPSPGMGQGSIAAPSPEEWRSPYPSLGKRSWLRPYIPREKPDPDRETPLPLPDPEKAEAFKERFRAVLGKMRLSKAERDELSARIERRLVLTGSQLEDVSLRYEKLEARGLDYVGKAAIAKQAIGSRSPIEIVWLSPEGKENRFTGIPQALDKQG
ncbi:MAG: hypothetical protein LBP32_08570, partial [Spirochaetaceae bacterium]|nr:hypothetical protein [Spirochaetaceae bacterium]